MLGQFELPQGIPQVSPLVGQLTSRSKALLNSSWFNDSQLFPSQGSNEPTPQNYVRDMSRWGTMEGFAENVPRSLIGTESGGNWLAENAEKGAGGHTGHFGILQFGPARLEDIKRAGVLPAEMTPQQFKQNKAAQVAAANWHFNDIDQNIRKHGYDRLIGQSVGGVPISMNGMRAMAHLGGFGGLSRFLMSGGQYNPADSFGTSLAAYGKTHHG
jgi:hypothetical protein